MTFEQWWKKSASFKPWNIPADHMEWFKRVARCSWHAALNHTASVHASTNNRKLKRTRRASACQVAGCGNKATVILCGSCLDRMNRVVRMPPSA
jgi:hypothetical protein